MTFKCVGMALSLSLLGVPLAAQQAPPELPDEVQSFMERDQLQRWAQMIRVGDSLFNDGSCRRCHGEGVMGEGIDSPHDAAGCVEQGFDGGLGKEWVGDASDLEPVPDVAGKRLTIETD